MSQSKPSFRPDFSMIEKGWRCKCPRCAQGDLFQSKWSLDLRSKCDQCGLDLTKNDTADGPAVFIIFILGFLLVPLALVVDALYEPALWVHAVLWTVVALFLTLGMLRPIKAYVIALQYKHCPGDWD